MPRLLRAASDLMPFTPTHILAIVPVATVRRWQLPFSALAIGTMIPDLPLFVPIVPGYQRSHSVPGLFLVCWPLGLLAFVVFQVLMRRPLFALLPQMVQQRCGALVRPCIEPTVRFWVLASVAVVFGAFTHLVWDSFTHEGRIGTQWLPILNRTCLTLRGQGYPGYKVLQYGCSVVGLPLLAWLLVAWLWRQPVEPIETAANLGPASKVVAGLVAVGVPALVSGLLWLRHDLSGYVRLGRAITTSGLLLLIVTGLYCLTFLAIESKLAHGKTADRSGRTLI